jgi:hypothetical protein
VQFLACQSNLTPKNCLLHRPGEGSIGSGAPPGKAGADPDRRHHHDPSFRQPPCWQRLATSGTQKLKTQHLGTQLLLKRLERSADPPAKAAELHAFFTKWERILANEVQQLATL